MRSIDFIEEATTALEDNWESYRSSDKPEIFERALSALMVLMACNKPSVRLSDIDIVLGITTTDSFFAQAVADYVRKHTGVVGMVILAEEGDLSAFDIKGMNVLCCTVDIRDTEDEMERTIVAIKEAEGTPLPQLLALAGTRSMTHIDDTSITALVLH